ncbi:hypothetical protein [Winogradskyella sp. SYSU M77433]|uniref:hypothetical protein n=1 Tax=Winogradskyella sp. SYSU M77433 TaxID=3042722 RepID=UPI0024816B31|nr:hypothetical protein [Winogradskyella sp. SYSU M77433]MDH7913208.1 hypothetical protein [Winogradskyella sp. SYSU M77433]
MKNKSDEALEKLRFRIQIRKNLPKDWDVSNVKKEVVVLEDYLYEIDEKIVEYHYLPTKALTRGSLIEFLRIAIKDKYTERFLPNQFSECNVEYIKD